MSFTSWPNVKMLDKPPFIWHSKNCPSLFCGFLLSSCVAQTILCCVCVYVSVAQKQCCLSSVKGSQCDSGMMSARGGDTCEVDEEKQCTDDSHQVHFCLTIMKSLTAMLFCWSHHNRVHAVERNKKQKEDALATTYRHDVMDGWYTHFFSLLGLCKTNAELIKGSIFLQNQAWTIFLSQVRYDLTF